MHNVILFNLFCVIKHRLKIQKGKKKYINFTMKIDLKFNFFIFSKCDGHSFEREREKKKNSFQTLTNTTFWICFMNLSNLVVRALPHPFWRRSICYWNKLTVIRLVKKCIRFAHATHKNGHNDNKTHEIKRAKKICVFFFFFI